MRARTVYAAAIFAFCTAFQSTTFDGCAGGPGPAVPVPASPDPTCILDEDCPPTACEDRRCLGGICTVVSPLRDADGDGASPPPCGEDCDDTNRDVSPTEPEACDGLDQDCDGLIDEAAPPAAVQRVLGLAESEIHAAAFGSGMIVLETASTAGLSARFVGFDGTVGTAVDLEVGEDPSLYDVATTDEGAVAVVHHASAGTLEGIPIAVGPGDEPVAGARFVIADVSTEPMLAALRAEGLPIVAPDGTTSLRLAVSYRDVLGGSAVWAEGFAGPVARESTGSGAPAPDLATDGTLLVVASGTLDARFLDVETGADVVSQTLPGRAWARHPLGSADGRVIAIVQDAFDHALTSFTTTTASALRPAPAAMPRGLPARIDTGPEFHVITRFDDPRVSPTSGLSGVWAWIIDPTSLEQVASFTREEVSGPGGAFVEDYDVVVSESGAAVLSSFGLSGTTVTTFACRDGG